MHKRLPAFLLACAAVLGGRGRAWAGAGRLSISEVYPHGAGEFVELHNDTDAPIVLAGYHLVGAVRHILGQTTLAPDGYLVIAHGPRAVEAEFGPVVVAETLWGRLHDGGELRLFDPAGELLDWVRYPALESGRSFQRRKTSSSYRGPMAWASAPPTPGRPNDVPPLDPGVLALDALTRTPLAPTPAVGPLVTVRVHGAAARVRLLFENRERGCTVAMEPRVRDGGAVVYGARIPPLQGVVRYRVVAEDAAGGVAALEDDPFEGRPLRYASIAPVASGSVPALRLEIAPSVLEAVLAGGRGPVTVIDAERSPPVVIDGATLEASGDSPQRRWQKPPLRLRLPSGANVRGCRDLRLRTSWRDATYLREALALDVYRRSGVPAPEARLVTVEANGAFLGLYTAVEAVDRRFLARNALSGGALFKARADHDQLCDGRPLPSLGDYRLHWDADPDAPFEELRDFLEGLQAREGEALERFLEERLDVERYLRYLAATALVSHWDSVARNVYWCFDGRGTRRWVAIPWDLDQTWGLHETGGWLTAFQPAAAGTWDRPLHRHRRRARGDWDRVRDRVLSSPPLGARYLDTLATLASEQLRPDALAREIDGRLAAIERDVLLDRARWPSVASKIDGRLVDMPFTREHLHRAREHLELYVRERSAALARSCAERREPRTAEDRRAAARGDLVALAGLYLGLPLLFLSRRAS